jgi:hypothetical protein
MLAPERRNAKTSPTNRASAAPRIEIVAHENRRGSAPAPLIAQRSEIAASKWLRSFVGPTRARRGRGRRSTGRLIRQGENAARQI